MDDEEMHEMGCEFVNCHGTLAPLCTPTVSMCNEPRLETGISGFGPDAHSEPVFVAEPAGHAG